MLNPFKPVYSTKLRRGHIRYFVKFSKYTLPSITSPASLATNLINVRTLGFKNVEKGRQCVQCGEYSLRHS